MTKYSKLVQEEKKGVKTVFTHSLDKDGFIVEHNTINENWCNIKLLKHKRDGLDQFLVWSDETNYYYILLGKKGTEFDNL